jgi:son of sevenless-like protein
MLTFRSFTSGDELLDLLFERYDIAEPAGITELQLVDWKKQKQTPIRLRWVGQDFSSAYRN